MRAGRRPTNHAVLKNMEKESEELLAAQPPLSHWEDTGAQPIQSFMSEQRTKRQFQTVNTKPFTKGTLQ